MAQQQQSFYQDSSVSSENGARKLGNLLQSIGKGGYALLLILGVAVPMFLFGPLGLAAGATIAPQAIGLFAGGLGALTAAGGLIKAADSYKHGQKTKALKEGIVAAAEGAFIGFNVLPKFLDSVIGPSGNSIGAGFMDLITKPLVGIAIALAEPISKMMTGKTLTSNVGNLVGVGLDSVIKDQPQQAQQPMMMPQQAVAVAAPAQGMAPQMGQGQMIAGAGAPTSAVPAAVGYTGTEQQLAQGGGHAQRLMNSGYQQRGDGSYTDMVAAQGTGAGQYIGNA